VNSEVQGGPPQAGAVRTAVLAVILVLPAWILRSVALSELGSARGATLFRGFAADFTATLCFLLLVLLAAHWRRWAAVFMALLWVLLQNANYEHVLALDAPLSFTHAGYLADSTFLLGSGLVVSRPLLLLCLLGMVGISTWGVLDRSLGRRSMVALLSCALAACAALWIWPAEPQALAWKRSHFLGEELQRYGALGRSRSSASAPGRELTEEVTRIWRSDLSGEPWTDLDRTGRNILLVVLEGVSGAYLPTVADRSGVESSIEMPQLDRLARGYPTATRFIAQQRQTNRGLYALLCGRSPRLGSRAPRLNDYALGPSTACLPEVLAADGYRTVFMQASPLSFMFKGQAMPRLGFETVIGERGDEPAYFRSQWGIDDRAFLEHSIDQVLQLEVAGDPWFLTLLTVGTHHPYTVPVQQDGGAGDRLAAAMAYLDEAVGEFVVRLEKEGILEDTLVIFTSDESAGLPQGADDLLRTLSQNWSFAILMVPQEGPRWLDEPFLQSDLALSLLDYLGLDYLEETAAADWFTGRSLFRRHDTGRPLFFANTHQGRIYGLFPADHLLACREGAVDCRSIELAPGGPFSGSLGIGAPGPRETEMLRAAIQLSMRAGGLDSGRRVYQLLDEPSVPLPSRRRIVFSGQYLDVPTGSVVEVDLLLRVEGERGWIHLRHDLVSREDKHYLANLPVMGPGDSVRLRYRLHPGRSLSDLNCRLFADLLDGEGMRLEFEIAELRVLPGSGDDLGTGVEILEESVQRRVAPPKVRSLLKPSAATLAACAAATDGAGILATGCSPGEVLIGPGFYAPRGTRIEVVHRLEGLQGTVRLRSVVGSQSPSWILSEGPVRSLGEGESLELVLSLEVTAALNELAVSLVIDEGSTGSASFRVRETVVTMELP